MSVLSRRHLRHDALFAALAGLALGGVVLGFQLRPKTSTEVAIGAVAVALGCAIFGDARRFLLAAVVFDISLEWGKNVSHQHAAVKFGAISALQLSVTTMSLVSLYALWVFLPRARGAPRRRLRIAPAMPLIAFLLVNGLSLLAAHNRTLAAYQLVLLTQTLLLFIYIASTVDSRHDLNFIVTMIIVAVLAESALILFLRVTGRNISFLGISTTVDSSYGSRVGGTFGSPNNAASYLCIFLPLLLVMCVSPSSDSVRRLARVATPFGVIALVLTGSRGGWAAFAISIGFLAIWLVRRRIVRARTVAVAMTLLVILMAPLYASIASRISGNDNGAAHSRVTLAEISWQMIKTHPLLGVGANNEAVQAPSYAGPVFDGDWLAVVHNQYLLVFSEGGIFALLTFVWFLLATVRRGLRTAQVGDSMLSAVALGLTAGFIGRICHMMVDHFSGRDAVQALLLVASLLVATEAIAHREIVPSPAPWKPSPGGGKGRLKARAKPALDDVTPVRA